MISSGIASQVFRGLGSVFQAIASNAFEA